MTMKHRVWFDPNYDKYETEAEDGIDFDAPSPEAAAEAFARDRYDDYHQLGPGVVLVRDPTGQVTRFNIGVRTVFTVAKDKDQTDMLSERVYE